MKVLITGVCGFIGMHTAISFLKKSYHVIGIDNLSSANIDLKKSRLNQILPYDNFTFLQIDICNRKNLMQVFDYEKPQLVIHLAAQTGVRHSLKEPFAYGNSNLLGFINILEGCRHSGVMHLVYASSSSVYGLNSCVPFSEHQATDHPLSLYAATKKANELMAHSYSHLFGLPTTGLRFFTVYGPWGRPDMAPFLFIKAVFAKTAIDVFNHGQMMRDFTYVDDVVEGIHHVIEKPASANPVFDPYTPDPATSSAPYRIFNIGNSHPISLMEFIHQLEKCTGLPIKKNYLDIQPGDMLTTHSDINNLYE